jgi:hypothetical protein
LAQTGQGHSTSSRLFERNNLNPPASKMEWSIKPLEENCLKEIIR